jgi:Glyoxalase-like domain
LPHGLEFAGARVTSTAWTITFDCADPAVLAAFWYQALGYAEAAPPAGSASWEQWLASVGVPQEEWGDGAYIEDPQGLRPGISFLRVPEPKTAKNRVHLDVQAGGGRGGPQEVRWARVLEAVRRLTEAGATVIREDLQDGVADHFVMADPEGNEFCVL